MRPYLFQLCYWILSVVYVLCALPLLALPGRAPIRWIILQYTRSMNAALHHVGGIRKQVRGREHLPAGGFILGAKHQSWGDGFLIYPEVGNLAFVTGDHLERFPLVGGILKKLGAIVIDTCGGGDSKARSLINGLTKAKEEGRRILIYPEGHLAPVGQHFRYKAGIWHMAQAMDVPVIPVATNLGCFWPQQGKLCATGQAIIEFLEPIPNGLPKDVFLSRLTEAVETRTAELVAEAIGGPLKRAVQIPDPSGSMPRINAVATEAGS